MVEEKVKSIIDTLSQADTDNFIETICLSLAKAIKADFVFIAKLHDNQSQATTVALASQGDILDNFTYQLTSTPCENVSHGDVCCHLSEIQQAYPEDQLLIDMEISGYVGIPLKNIAGDTDSILVALYRQPIINDSEARSLFLLFSGMIKKELEKQELIKELKTRNEIIEQSKEAIIVCDKNKRIISVNRAFSNISGYSFREVQGKEPSMLSSGLTDKSLYKDMWQSINETGAWSGEVWNKKKNGEIYPEWLSINTICNEDGDIDKYIAFFFDISKSKASEETIYQQANFDLLTGIANRFLFLEKLSELIIEKKHNTDESSVLHMDLDLFKEINDVYGHDVGDELLIQASQRLKKCIKNSDCVARVSGDGFAILLESIDEQNSVNAIVNHLLLAFSKPFIINQSILHCTLSIGIALFSSDEEKASEIMKRAETAMYHAKDSGRNSFSYFTQQMHDLAHHRLKLKSDLTRALNDRELSVVYQPVICTADKKVSKFEALVRWNNQGKWVSPEEFIPIAEEFSLIKQLGEFVLSESCITLKQLKSKGYSDIVFNVNRSVYEVPLNKNENEQWLEIIELHGLQPCDICFELTESALAPDKRNNEVLFNQIRQAGCTIALDDFGTGYSSLSYLRRIPIDYIKIDKSFITDMSTNENDNILVSTIIAMSKALGKMVVAEGVETKEHLGLLTDLGCDYIQGYYFSRPLPEDSLVNFLDNFCYE